METKIHLSIICQDGRMMTKAEARKADKNGKIGYLFTKTKVFNPEKDKLVTVKVRNSKETRRSLNISKEAYYHMISNDGCPENCQLSLWKKLNKMQRIDLHMSLICDTLGGKSYEFYIFED